MTTPNQAAPDGSYTIGGGQFRYGQALQEDMVRALMMAGLAGMRLSSITDAVPLIEGALRRLPLDALRMARPFIFGATDADFADVDTAVATIMNSLKIREVFTSLGDVQNLIDQLIRDIVRIFTGFPDGLAALEAWWTQLTALFGALHPNQLLGTLQHIVNQLFTLLTGIITHPDKTLKDVVDALQQWLTNTFGAVQNLVDNLVRNLQTLVDGVWNLLVGSTGQVGKTVDQLVQALKDWLDTVFGGLVTRLQELIDGIVAVVGGALGGGTGNPVQAAVDAILGIFGLSQSAAASAANAQLGVEELRAVQAGGKFDEFDYPAAATLPANLYTVTYTGPGSATMGPNGRGILAWNAGSVPLAGTAFRNTIYRRSDAPLPGDIGTITVVLSKPPHTDPLVVASFSLCARMSAADAARTQATITGNQLHIQLVNAAGSVVNVGAGVPVTPTAGDVWTMKLTPTGVEVLQNGTHILTRTVGGVIDAAHRYVGFAVHQPAFTWLTGHPVPELAGWTWSPV